MKPDIHPEYRFVVFQDMSAGTSFLTRSTISTTETTTFEGNEYPLAKVEISSESHPFFTGQMKIVDTAGRVERFEKRYGQRKGAKGADEAVAEAPVAEAPVAEAPVAEAPVAEAAVAEAPVVEAAAEPAPESDAPVDVETLDTADADAETPDA